MHKQPHLMTPITNNAHHHVTNIAEELKYLRKPFPQNTVQAARNYKHEITPKLLDFLYYAYQNHESLHPNYMGHLYALFLLAEFRETKAFDIAIKILELPEKSIDFLLGDCLTEDYHKILASLYDNNLESIKNIIESQGIYPYARIAAINTLIILVKKSIIKREDIIQYTKILFHHPVFRSDATMMGCLVSDICDLQPIELQNEIEQLFQLDLIDKSIIDLEYTTNLLNNTDNYQHDDRYEYIENTIDSMQWWASFNEDESSLVIPNKNQVKIGRNDPCLCGSGKKYKKCCL